MTDIGKERTPFQATHNRKADEQRFNRPELVVYEIEGTRFEVTPRYEVQKVLGKGGYGLVVQALDRVSKKKVAIKKICNIFEKKSIIQKRILREIKILRHFQNHENVCVHFELS
jgi:serine/threonine protein kinase